MVYDEVTLLVSSCDKYSTAWFPFFELIKYNWPGHPQKIVLNTETINYSHKGLSIETITEPYINSTWSQRLLNCLNKITTDYIIFSLEDFFIQCPIKEDILEYCLEKMKNNPKIACFRLKASNEKNLKKSEYDPFYLADESVPYRLDTQFSIWRKEILISFINEKESPWEFEGKGTERIKGTDKLFYWFYNKNPEKITDELIVPYVIGHFTGYGIQWGKWLYNNKELFEKYKIKVDFNKLGMLNERSVNFRMKTVYNPNATGIYKYLKFIFLIKLKLEHCIDILKNKGFISFVHMLKMRGRK